MSHYLSGHHILVPEPEHIRRGNSTLQHKVFGSRPSNTLLRVPVLTALRNGPDLDLRREARHLSEAPDNNPIDLHREAVGKGGINTRQKTEGARDTRSGRGYAH